MDGRRIAVVGDLMLDRYIWGSVNRISPEAPVPIIDMESEQARLGGAANVARNIKALGGEPFLIGVIGADNSGKQLFEIIRECDFPTDGVVVDGNRPTTVKTRVIAHSQHVVRIDREMRSDISHIIQNKILDVLRQHIESLDGIIIEDYNKGVVVQDLIGQVIELANEHNTHITIDPKFNNFFEYKNVTVFKPNRSEVEEVLGARLRNEHDVLDAGRLLLQRLKAKNVLLTLGEQGMSLFESNGTICHAATKARNVADVSGAGDSVISTLTMALAGGATVREAATLANFAGGIVCGYVGIVPIDKQELTAFVRDDMDKRLDHGKKR
ncbi:MAG: D-glycero-beta-D-manno-heptose-7-phosphate kinase [Ignavibacteriae bacterium]|nr:D-glycero-beta-D-manno-heptose-7-phosphate kinase [Ignavibacteria bacterium]MBI3364898.1 D-glycero-beta-D-manno-heptose-7-phosphate kinase [Ignavibacteriota bacterium]